MNGNASAASERPSTAAGDGFAARYGPVAVVTGASDGIGRAVAAELAAAGLDLVLVARRPAELQRLAAELGAEHGIVAQALPLDLSRPGAAARLDRETGALDVGLLVAAAGFGTSGPLLDAELATEREMVDVNCGAVLELSQAFGRRFAARRSGGLVLFGSLVGWQGTPHAANYAATKAYVQSLAEGLRIELARSGVDVLAVAPGPVASGFATRARMTMGSAASPAIVARAVVRSLGRRATIVPGSIGKLLTASLSLLPRSLRVRIMGAVMRGMTKNRGAPHETAGP